MNISRVGRGLLRGNAVGSWRSWDGGAGLHDGRRIGAVTRFIRVEPTPNTAYGKATCTDAVLCIDNGHGCCIFLAVGRPKLSAVTFRSGLRLISLPNGV